MSGREQEEAEEGRHAGGTDGRRAGDDAWTGTDEEGAAKSEMRRDPLTGVWTIYAPGRAERPGAPGPADGADGHDPGDRSAAARPRWSSDCPFCPGNEAHLPEILLERPSPEAPGWSVRAVTNAYPVVRALEDGWGVHRRGPYERAPAAGVHEVIVESPRHDVDLPDLSDQETAAVLDVYRERSAAAQRAGLRPVLFRNRGTSAGASQRHPHAQLVGMAVPPPLLTELEERMERHYERTRRCLPCEIAVWERSDGRRVLFDGEGVLAFVPYAAQPFEIRVLWPHGESWTEPSPQAASALGAALTAALRALRLRAGDPDYNLLVHIPPPAMPPEFRHGHIHIRPRLLTPAGLELAAGVAVSPLLPEESARLLADR